MYLNVCKYYIIIFTFLLENDNISWGIRKIILNVHCRLCMHHIVNYHYLSLIFYNKFHMYPINFQIQVCLIKRFDVELSMLVKQTCLVEWKAFHQIIMQFMHEHPFYVYWNFRNMYSQNHHATLLWIHLGKHLCTEFKVR